ncbi:MAG: hypothetical protein F6K17_27480 [Okeania sp. SIO3C4]|nr:hypothetical protein [Okeania sp. SIO3C4]
MTDKDKWFFGVEKSEKFSALYAQKGAYFRLIVGQKNHSYNSYRIINN